MGYSTNFIGGLSFNKELTHRQWLDLKQLADYSSRSNGTYEMYTESPETIPDSYLQWEPNEDGTAYVWNGGEKFYQYIHWLRWVIKHYMKPHGLVLNGQIIWQGEDVADTGVIVAVDNKITHQKLTKNLITCPNCSYRFVYE